MILMTKQQHATKLVNYLNHTGYLGYTISTSEEIPYCGLLGGHIGVSYCYPHLIKKEELSKMTWYNYHAAPLPRYGDWGNYARGLHDLQVSQDKELRWGVSLHIIDPGIDSGPILRCLDVPLLSKPCDIQELGDITHYYLFQLFKQTIHALKKEPKTKEELDTLCK